MRLNKRVVEGLAPPESGYAIYRDDALPGFGVRVTASGHRAFIFERRVHGKVRRMTLGRFGDLTCEQARRRAVQFAGEVATGKDPLEERQRRRNERVTLKEAMQGYIQARELKATTQYDLERAMRHLNDWMNRPLADISPELVRKRHASLGESSKARANLTMRYLRAVINFARAEYTTPEGEPVLAANPVDRISDTKSWFRVPRRQSVIKATELKPWMQAVMSLPNATPRDYLMLVILTGLRRQEALGLQWSQIDFKAGTLTLTDTKAHRPHVLPLSDYLHELLQRREKERTSEYVFADGNGRRLSNLRYAIDHVRKESGVNFCIHDLRRTFATVAESLDIPAYSLKRLLNHSTGADVTAGYLIVDTERLRQPMQKVTDFMLQMGGITHRIQPS